VGEKCVLSNEGYSFAVVSNQMRRRQSVNECKKIVVLYEKCGLNEKYREQWTASERQEKRQITYIFPLW